MNGVDAMDDSAVVKQGAIYKNSKKPSTNLEAPSCMALAAEELKAYFLTYNA